MSKDDSAFDFSFEAGGAVIVLSRNPLSAGCLSDEEVDFAIDDLKGDLDRLALRMKHAIKQQTHKSAFKDGKDA